MRIGVVGLQGAVSEHVSMASSAVRSEGLEGGAFWLRDAGGLESASGVIIPGGESTTISKLLVGRGMFDRLAAMGRAGLPIMGTCAGLIIVSSAGGEQAERTGQPLMGLLEAEVERNAFGRQRESFEAELDVEGVGRYPGVFIRAPAVTRVWGSTRALSVFDGRIVAARRGAVLGLAFHPELTGDERVHRLFCRVCREYEYKRATP
jgi:5'-phosphate synthase pdxT subunit